MSITEADDRVTTYQPVEPTSEFPAGFDIFDNDDITVLVDGVERNDFTVSATYVQGVSSDAKAVFNPGISGTVRVIGLRSPHRQSEFQSGAPIPTSQQNTALNLLQAQAQEARRDIDRSLKLAIGASALPEGHFPKADASGNMVDGGDGADITKAQEYAAAAKSDADRAAAAAAAVNLPSVQPGDAGKFLTVREDVTGYQLTPVPPNRIKTPYDFGASEDDEEDADQSIAVQALFDFVRSSYDPDVQAYKYVADLAGRGWCVDSSIDATLIRNPYMRIRNGLLHSRATGGIGLDLAGSNAVILEDLIVWGDAVSTPKVGVLWSRADINGSFPSAANNRAIDVTVNGYFSGSAVVDFASEVMAFSNCVWRNKHRSRNAFSLITCSNAGTLDSYIGGLVSAFVTIPTAADGNQSNTVKNWDMAHIERGSDIATPIESISKTNPAVVTMPTGVLATLGLSNGDEVLFHNNAGMTELNDNAYTIANVNEVNDTFELSGVDSTGYGAFTSGFLWNPTGPAILMNLCREVHGRAGYVLTYDAPSIVVDCVNGGGAPGMVDLEFHNEASVPSVWKLDLPSSGSTWQGWRFKILNQNQDIKTTIIDNTGTGTMAVQDFEATIVNLGEAPASKFFKNPGQFYLRKATIAVPLNAALNNINSYGEFYGSTFALDSSPYERVFGTRVFNGQATFGSYSATGTTEGRDILPSVTRSSKTVTSTADHYQFANPNGVVGHIQTSASATNYTTSSDERKKDFLGEYSPEEALAIIRADPVREFRWKVDGKLAVGWGAQTSFAVSPDLASYDEENDVWGVDQGKRTPYLWAAVSGLVDEIEALKAAIAKLQAS